MVASKLIQLRFSNVPERRMSEVMYERGGLDDVRTQSSPGISGRWLFPEELLGKSAPDLGDLQRVGQAVMEQVALGSANHLRHPRQTSQGVRIEDAIAIAFERGPLLEFLRIRLAAVLALGHWRVTDYPLTPG